MLSLPHFTLSFSPNGCKYAAHTFFTRYLTRTTRAQAREIERKTSLRRAELFDVPLPRVSRPSSRRCCRLSSVERSLSSGRLDVEDHWRASSKAASSYSRTKFDSRPPEVVHTEFDHASRVVAFADYASAGADCVCLDSSVYSSIRLHVHAFLFLRVPCPAVHLPYFRLVQLTLGL